MYTHSGIIVEMNGEPYLWHLGSDPQYDILSQKVVISTPALTTLNSIDVYKGTAYVFRCNKKSDLEVIDIVNNLNHIKFNGNTLLTAFVNGFKITPMAPKNKMMCTDFVETVMGELNIIDKNKVSGSATLNTIHSYIAELDVYDSNPVVLKNGYYNAIWE
jgi:hypothetical protein